MSTVGSRKLPPIHSRNPEWELLGEIGFWAEFFWTSLFALCFLSGRKWVSKSLRGVLGPLQASTTGFRGVLRSMLSA